MFLQRVLGLKKSMSYEENPVQILDRQVLKLRSKEIVSVKVLWRNQFVDEATWEAKEVMNVKYSHLFAPSNDDLKGNFALLSLRLIFILVWIILHD